VKTLDKISSPARLDLFFVKTNLFLEKNLKMLLILTVPLDAHADHVEQKLRERGEELFRFNPAQFPSQSEISLSYRYGHRKCILRTGEEFIDLNNLKAVWYRRPKQPIPHEEIESKLNREIVEVQCKNFIDNIWNSLDCPWFPASPFVIKRAELKTLQLKIATELNFELPPTLITNSPKDFLEFYCQHKGNIISKNVGSSFNRIVGKTFCRYTEVVSKRDVGYAQSISYCPMIFQAYVPKQLELRITVVAQKVFAAEIYSQQTNHTRYDWRRYDHHKMLYLPHELPTEIETSCIHLVEKLGLSYGAIDMILTPDGRYVFLEINPNGQYLWIEDATGLPISDAICDLLISGLSMNKQVENHSNHIQEISNE
jgi:hypothetical protein